MDKHSKTLEFMRRIGAPKTEKIRITGILRSPELTLITVMLSGEDTSASAEILSLLGSYRINIRFVSNYHDSDGNTALNIALEPHSGPTISLDLLRAKAANLNIRDLVCHRNVQVISVYPFRERARLAERLFTTLRLNGIEPLAANNASSVVSCVIRSEHLGQALASLNQVFELP
jgi:aspartokinase